MTPSSFPAVLARCCRCRARPIPQCPKHVSIPRSARYSTNPPHDDDPLPRKPHSSLLILEPPRKQLPAEFIFPVNAPSKTADSYEPLDQAKTILTYETEAALHMTRLDMTLMKPENDRVSEQRFVQLHQQLMKSFTAQQLRQYYQFSREEKLAEGKLLPKLASNATKARTATAILTKVWAIEKTEDIAERQDLVITKEIGCTKQQLFFLIGDDGQILHQWANQYTARITVNVQESNIKIEASQDGIEEIEKRMAILFLDAKSEELDLSAVLKAGQFDWSLVPAISRTTQTFIERLDDTNVRLSALTQERVDNARRLLFTSVPLSLRTESSLLCESSSDERVQAGLFPIAEPVALPWIDRVREWSRWRYVSQSKPLPKLFNRDRLDDLSPQSVLEVLESNAELQALPEEAEGEDLRLLTGTEAIFGHLLHQPVSDQAVTAPTLQSFIESNGGNRAFCHTFPGNPFFSECLKSQSPDDLAFVETFRLNFLPSPWKEPDTFTHYPPIQIMLPLDQKPDQPPRLPSIYALQSKTVADIMLPGEFCDLRFVRRQLLALRVLQESDSSKNGIMLSEWERFMAESNLNPSKDRKLRAASSLKIAIPPWMVNPDARYEGGPVEYTFAGMQYRRTQVRKSKNVQYSKTAVHGGTTGGKTTELKTSQTFASPEMASGGFEKLFKATMDGVVLLRDWMGR